MRIAFFGPLPPLKTGIADYDAALLPLLRQDYEVDVFLERATAGVDGFSHADFFSRNIRQPYDLSIYQMGNSPFHEYLYGYLFQNPGAVVFHDACLLHSRSEMLLKKGLTQEYRSELRAVYPGQGEEIANAVIPSAAGDLLFYQFPLFELALRSSLAGAAHTDFAVNQLSISETPVLKIPHVKLEGGTTSKKDLLAGKFVIASFGYVTNAKRIATLLQCAAEIKIDHPEIHCLIVGDVEDRLQLNKEIEQSGLQEQVLVTGRVDMQDFLGWMGRADAIVNLRFPSAGEMSGTLIRALGSGKPVIVSRLQALQEIPQNAALRIRPEQEKSDLKQALLDLLRNTDLRKTLSANAQNYIRANHAPAIVREQYKKLIEAGVARKSHFRRMELPAHLRSATELLRSYLHSDSLENLHSAEEFLFNRDKQLFF